jgi:phage shock protein E
MRTKTSIVALTLLSLLFLGCASTQPSQPLNQARTADQVWIDVRTAEEYQEQHLEGAINIEFTEILSGVTNLDKDAEIHLYCGSGRRAGIALEALESAGFTNVTNRGGLSDVLELEAP